MIMCIQNRCINLFWKDVAFGSDNSYYGILIFLSQCPFQSVYLGQIYTKKHYEITLCVYVEGGGISSGRSLFQKNWFEKDIQVSWQLCCYLYSRKWLLYLVGQLVTLPREAISCLYQYISKTITAYLNSRKRCQVKELNLAIVWHSTLDHVSTVMT